MCRAFLRRVLVLSLIVGKQIPNIHFREIVVHKVIDIFAMNYSWNACPIATFVAIGPCKKQAIPCQIKKWLSGKKKAPTEKKKALKSAWIAALRAIISGAEGGTRTHTLLRAADFESAASANSATSASHSE